MLSSSGFLRRIAFGPVPRPHNAKTVCQSNASPWDSAPSERECDDGIVSAIGQTLLIGLDYLLRFVGRLLPIGLVSIMLWAAFGRISAAQKVDQLRRTERQLKQDLSEMASDHDCTIQS